MSDGQIVYDQKALNRFSQRLINFFNLQDFLKFAYRLIMYKTSNGNPAIYEIK